MDHGKDIHLFIQQVFTDNVSWGGYLTRLGIQSWAKPASSHYGFYSLTEKVYFAQIFTKISKYKKLSIGKSIVPRREHDGYSLSTQGSFSEKVVIKIKFEIH